MSSGGGGDGVDTAYNARMASIAEKLQLGSDEDRNIFKYGVTYDPNESIEGYISKKGDFVKGDGTIIATKAQLDQLNTGGESNDGTTRSAQSNPLKKIKDWTKENPGQAAALATGDPAGSVLGYPADQAIDKYDAHRDGSTPSPAITSADIDPSAKLQTYKHGDLSGYDPSEHQSYMQMEQQQIADNMATMPYQKDATIAELENQRKQSLAAQELIDPTKELSLENIASQRRLLPGQEKATMAEQGYTTAKYNADKSLIGDETALKKGLIGEQSTNLSLRQPVTKAYYNEVMNGVDEKQRMNEASGEVGNAFASASDMTARNLSRYGINPNSARAKSEFSKTGLQYASALGGARNMARDEARKEKFRRYSDAVGKVPTSY